jgi:hypothetical protein
MQSDCRKPKGKHEIPVMACTWSAHSRQKQKNWTPNRKQLALADHVGAGLLWSGSRTTAEMILGRSQTKCWNNLLCIEFKMIVSFRDIAQGFHGKEGSGTEKREREGARAHWDRSTEHKRTRRETVQRPSTPTAHYSSQAFLIVFSYKQLPLVLQSSVGPWPLFQFLNPIRRRYDSLDQGSARRKDATCTQNNTNRINAHRHPCLEWDSNPRSQRPSERRQFMH